MDELTKKQRAIFDAMPVLQWVPTDGSVSMSAIARRGLLVSRYVTEERSYGVAHVRQYMRLK